MTALQAFLKAQKEIWSRRGIVGFLYVFNVLMAALLTLPIGGRLDRLANKELADHLIDGFALDYVIEYFQKYGDSFQAIIAMLIGVGFFYVLTNTFLAGGILGVLAREKRFRLRPFLHESANMFGRFVRLLLLSLVVLALLYFVVRLAVLSPLRNLADSANPDVKFQIQLLSILITLLLIGFWNMLFDYAKITIHSRDIGSVFVGFFSSVRFALRHPLQTIGLYFLNYVIVAVLFVLYLVVENQFSNTTAASTYGLLAVQQLFILSRLWMKTSFFASQQVFYFDRHPEEAIQLAWE